MRRKNPFKRHRLTGEVILSAVWLYLRYPLSYADMRDLLKGIEAIRTIKHNHTRNIQSGVGGEIEFVTMLFGVAV